MKLKIKITKEIIRQSHMCGTDGFDGAITKNCAVALAVRDIFPIASVGTNTIKPDMWGMLEIELPMEAKNFIREFDLLRQTNPKARLLLNPFEFEIDLPESIVEAINISDIHKSATLEVVQG